MTFYGEGPSPSTTPYPTPSTPTASRPLFTEILNMPMSTGWHASRRYYRMLL